VQFGISRAMSILNRRRYEVSESEVGRWLYWEAQRTDEWEGGSYPYATPEYEGTSVRAGLEVIRQHGIVPARTKVPRPVDGIEAYRWAQTCDEVLAALGTPQRDYVELLNSWGRHGYPHRVRMSCEVLERLIREDGEVAIITDR
jgi:hypothetical protein